MRESPHSGEVVVEVAGEVVPIRFTWAGLSRLHGEFGTEWDQVVERAFSDLDVVVMSQVLAAASDRSPEWWLEASPPFVPAVHAARRALHLAFFGPGKDGEAAEKPANPRMRLAIRTWFAGLFGSGAKSPGAPRPSSSGA